MGRWQLYLDGDLEGKVRKDDGSRVTHQMWTQERGYEAPPANFLRVTTFAHAITDVTGPEALQSRIVNPLLKSIEYEIK